MIGVQSVFAIIILLIVAFVCPIKHVSLAISDTIAVLSIFYTTIFVDWIRQDGIGKGISDLRNVLKHKEKKCLFICQRIIAKCNLCRDDYYLYDLLYKRSYNKLHFID